jgi:hypothetical protein
MTTEIASVFTYNKNTNDDLLHLKLFNDWMEVHNPEFNISIDMLFLTDTYFNTVSTICGNFFSEKVKKYTALGQITIYDENLYIEIFMSNEEPFTKIKREATVNIYGPVNVLEKFYNKINDFKEGSNPILTWWYKAGNNIQNADFSIDTKMIFRPEFYPWIEDVDQYIKDFDESSANILLLLGDPGTGKTSFLRYIMQRFSKNAMTTYDESIMAGDEIYITFISSRNFNYLMLEDSDLILGSRGHDSNATMSKILNAADGLVPLSKKKFIFTANIKDSSKIDEAFLRPGRCFDVLNFRPLTEIEAQAAAKSIGKTLDTKAKEYTIAEIFNGSQKNYFKSKFAY